MSDAEIKAVLNVEAALRKLEKVTVEESLKKEAALIRAQFQRRRVALEHVHDTVKISGDFGVGNE